MTAAVSIPDIFSPVEIYNEKRPIRFELMTSEWKSEVLPLNYGRIIKTTLNKAACSQRYVTYSLSLLITS